MSLGLLLGGATTGKGANNAGWKCGPRYTKAVPSHGAEVGAGRWSTHERRHGDGGRRRWLQAQAQGSAQLCTAAQRTPPQRNEPCGAATLRRSTRLDWAEQPQAAAALQSGTWREGMWRERAWLNGRNRRLCDSWPGREGGRRGVSQRRRGSATGEITGETTGGRGGTQALLRGPAAAI